MKSWTRKTTKPKLEDRIVPHQVTGAGFFVPMDIAPGEFGSTIDYAALKAGMLAVIDIDYGERCETKDTEDFPELLGKTELSEGRCPVCLVYERFDKLWEIFALGQDDE